MDSCSWLGLGLVWLGMYLEAEGEEIQDPGAGFVAEVGEAADFGLVWSQ